MADCILVNSLFALKTSACQLCIYLSRMQISADTWPPIIYLFSFTKKRTTRQVTGGGYISSHFYVYNCWSNRRVISCLSYAFVCCPKFSLMSLPDIESIHKVYNLPRHIICIKMYTLLFRVLYLHKLLDWYLHLSRQTRRIYIRLSNIVLLCLIIITNEK